MSPNPFLQPGSESLPVPSPSASHTVGAADEDEDDTDPDDNTLTPRSLARKYKERSDRNVNIGGRVVTTQEGRALAVQQRQARIEKQRKAEELKQKKLDAICEQRQRRQTLGRDGMSFTGALTLQKLASLADIAWCMDLAESGTREELIKRISSHVDAHPEIRTDKRFSGLWKRTSRRSQQENVAVTSSGEDQQSQQLHVDDVSDMPMVLYDDDRDSTTGMTGLP